MLQKRYKNDMVTNPDFFDTPPTNFKSIKLEEVESKLCDFKKRFDGSSNIMLRNAYNFGKWLNVARKVFQREKVLKQKKLQKTFAIYVKEIANISKQTQWNYKQIYKLIEKAPKIMKCQIKYVYLIQKNKILMAYFNTEDSVWKHPRDCDCTECIAYFPN